MISIAGFLLLFGGLIGLLMLIAAPIVLALFIVGLALRLVFFVLFLPFRIIGGLFGLALPALGLGLGALLLLGAIPLLPLILVAAGIYLVFRGMRRHPAPVSPSPGS